MFNMQSNSAWNNVPRNEDSPRIAVWHSFRKPIMSGGSNCTSAKDDRGSVDITHPYDAFFQTTYPRFGQRCFTHHLLFVSGKEPCYSSTRLYHPCMAFSPQPFTYHIGKGKAPNREARHIYYMYLCHTALNHMVSACCSLVPANLRDRSTDSGEVQI